MNDHAVSYMQDKFKILYDSIENISSDKRKGQMQDTELVHLRLRQKELVKELLLKEEYICALQTERDTFRQETFDLNEIKSRIVTKHKIFQTASRSKIERMEFKIIKLQK
jgi:hypothetical protein